MRGTVLALSFGLVLVASAPFVLGQRAAGGRPQARPYDPATEVTLVGAVESVTNQTGRRGMTGLHIALKTESETVAVHLGPAWFLHDQGMAVAVHDELEVVGSRVTIDGKDIVLARSVTKGQVTATLRDEQGIPRWSRSRPTR